MLYRLAAILLSLSTVSLAEPALPTIDCPILGPAFPADFNISNSRAFQKAVAAFPSQIEELFDSGALNKSSTSFFIDVFSTQTNSSIYQYSHSGKDLDSYRTAGVIDDGTIFRVGSVSKLFTAYAIIAKAGLKVFEDLVVKYLPELKGDVWNGRILWEEVTVGALLSQMGGTGGFDIDQAICTVLGNCSIPGFLAQMRDQQAARSPVFQTPLYSDASFGVLGRVLERMTNQTYNEAIQSILSVPLDLKNSGTVTPPSEGLNALALPSNSSSWGLENPIIAPSGGIYSNARDLRTLGLSIMHSKLLSEAHTRQWMKPHAHTSSLAASVGAPWEIYRLALPVSPSTNRTRISDIYTKTGGQQAYGTIFALSPEHKLGFSINVGGPLATSDRVPLREVVGSSFIVAAEHAAWENAATNYAGTFAYPQDQTINMTLTVDTDGPGLGLKSLFYQGRDLRGFLISYGLLDVPKDTSVRLYPSGTQFKGASGGVVKVFNAAAVAGPDVRAAVEGGVGLFNAGCETWLSTGFWNTTNFELGVVDGKVQSVRSPVLNITLNRVE